MQHQHHHLEQYDEKLNQMKEQMKKVEEEKCRAFNDLMEMKRVAEETNVMVDEVMATKRIPDTKNSREYNNNSIIEALEKSEKGLELEDDELGKLRKEMDVIRSSEADSMALSFDYKRKVQELEAELDKRRESEANLFDTLVMQTKQLEQNKILLEESKLEIASLEEKIKALEEGGATQIMKIPLPLESEFGIQDSTIDHVKYETEVRDSPRKELVNVGLLNDNKGEGLSKKAQTLLEELNSLKSELKLATQAEENSKKAMDDLALALKEVATEANQVKAKLTLSQVELEHTKGDAERWRAILETTEEKYKELLDVTRKEADRFRNTAERLRMEAEESLLAWNGKETEFVNCIRRAEEERLIAQQESIRIVDMLSEAERKTMVSKEENQKLRDILKQALNEANVAKEAAEIAKAENARLQDSLTLLVQENEMLKIHEAASFENIKELKRMLSESSIKEFKNDDIDRLLSDKESGKKTKAQQHSHSSTEKDSKNLNKTFSFNLKDMITPHNKQQHKVGVNEEANNKETIDDDTLRGSIFDEVDSSDSESRHDEMTEDFDHLDDASDRNNRKRRALLRRFGDLIRRKGYHYHQKEPSNEENLQT